MMKTTISKKLLVCILMFIMIFSNSLIPMAEETTGSVYYVAPDGSDENAGDIENPFKTIQHAIDVMTDGSTLYIRAGVYDEQLNIQSKNYITVKNYENELVQICKFIYVNQCYNITIQGLKISLENNDDALKIYSSYYANVTGIDASGRVCFYDSKYCTLSSSFIHDYTGAGAVTLWWAKYNKILNNVIYNNGEYGVYFLVSGTEGNEVYNNTFYNNRSKDIFFNTYQGNPHDNIIKNNIITKGIQLNDIAFVTTNTWDYNCYSNLSESIGNIIGDYENGITLDKFKELGVEEHGFLGDPAFYNADNRDFRLKQDSSCIDKGTDENAPLVDFGGNERKSPVDVGAYEYDENAFQNVEVLSKKPTGQSENIDVEISITFNTDIDPNGINEKITLSDSQGNKVNGIINVKDNIVTLKPIQVLKYSTVYTVTIGAGLSDINGKQLPGEYSWSFKTKSDEPDGNVYYLAPYGNDNNPGTIEAPFKDITYASARLQPGDTLIIREGTYDGYLLIWGKGSANSKPIVVRNYDGEKVVLINTVANTSYITYVGRSYNVRISGLIVTNDGAMINGDKKQNYGMYIHESQNVKIDHCVFYDTPGGIQVRENSEQIDISSNIFHHNDWRYGAICFYNGIKNSKIYNNVFYNNFYGIFFYNNRVTNNMFFNNTFYRNNSDITENEGGISEGNIFKNNCFSSIFENPQYFTEKNIFDYNVYNSNTLTNGISNGITFDQFQATGQEAHGIFADPKFKDADNHNFDPGDGSCCIGVGTKEFALGVDILGRVRTDAMDIGAYKYVGGKVYYVGPSGDDNNTGSLNLPFKTIQKAVSVMQPKDCLLIKQGIYNENMMIDNKNDITIKNYENGVVSIVRPVTVKNSQNIQLEGLNLNPVDKLSALTANGVKNLHISKMNVTGRIYLFDTKGYEISSCFIHDCEEEGGIVLYWAQNGVVINNVIYNNQKKGIYLLSNGTKYNKIVNNTFYNNLHSDILINSIPNYGTANNNVFKNNIFTKGMQLGSMEAVNSNVFNYNCYINALVGTISGEYSDGITLEQFKNLAQEQNGFTGDPEFNNTMNNDFRITRYSCCRNMGDWEDAPEKDINGVTRGRVIDVGAYNYTGITRTYFVSTNGSDDYNGTEGYPLRTIQTAVNRMKPGETLLVRGGIYSESIIINGKKGTVFDYYYIKNYPNEKVVLDGSNEKDTAVTIIGNSGFWNMEGIDIQYFKKYGFDIKDSQNIKLSLSTIICVPYGVYGQNLMNCTIEKINVQGVQEQMINNGIYLNNCSDCLITQCFINSAVNEAIYFEAGKSNKITSSIITNNKTGIKLDNCQNGIIYNNSFYNNQECDVELGQNTINNAIKNNIFSSENSYTIIKLTDDSVLQNDFDYNCYHKKENEPVITYQNGEAITNLNFTQFKNIGKETKGILADPMYYDPANGDFDLRKGSVCIGGGINDENAPIVGFDGVAFQKPIDMGALYSTLSFRSYYVSPDGDNGADGSIEHPWRTVWKGMTSLKPSDTLYIRGGHYNERVNINDMNAIEYRGEQLWYTVKNYPGEEVIFDSDDTLGVGIKFTKSSYWKLEGLKFTEYTGAAVWAADKSHHIVMDNLEIWDISNPSFVQSGTEGILGDGGTYCTVKNCRIYNIGSERQSMADHGIYIGYGAHHWVIDSNIIYDIPGGAIQLYGTPCGGDDSIITNNIVYNSMCGITITRSRRCVISNNTFYNNWYNDIYMDYFLQDTVIQNNIFYNDYKKGTIVMVEDRANEGLKEFEIDPTVLGIYSIDVRNNTFRNNIIMHNTFGARVRCLTDEGINGKFVPINDYIESDTLNTYQNLIEADPLFMDATNCDFRLKDSSPCIDAGVLEYSPVKDYLGHDRINKPDIGAIEQIVSIQYIRQLMEGYIESGDLKGPLVDQLTNALEQAEHQLNKGLMDHAIKHMEDFLKHLNNIALEENVSEAARKALFTEVTTLIEFWEIKM